jgi:hypothetical protein
VTRGLSALVALAAFALACNGSIRFDETALDSGSPTCPSGLCGWEISDDCDGGVCPLECHSSMMCVGTCGTSCVAECEGNSRCTLTTGAGARVTCKSDASCSFVLGDRGRAHCDPGSTCGVRCAAQCTLECDPGLTCQLQCGSGPSAPVSGITGCP